MNTTDLARLQEELLRVVAQGGKFEIADGSVIDGATESDVIAHLTSRYSPVNGRKFRFPGIASGWRFETEIEAAGFRVVHARNSRNQKCRVITL